MPFDLINLVCTRCTDGDHAKLQRWYNDHAQLLMASPELQNAQLYRCETPGSSERIFDYFCTYHFAQSEDFSAFDSGQVMAHVRELSNAALGRSSIEIVKRTQYARVLHRRWDTNPLQAEMQVCLFTFESDQAQQLNRWLNDVLYQLHVSHGLQAAQAYRSAADGKELFLLLEPTRNQALPTDWYALSSPYAQSTHIKPLWRAHAHVIGQWLR